MFSLQISDKPIDDANTNVGTKNDGNHKITVGDNIVKIDVLKSTTRTDLKSDFSPTNRMITGNDTPAVRSEMNETLDVLNAIEKACDEGTKTQLNLDRKTQYVGTVKNLFYKFLGFFSKSLEIEKRTQDLNAKLHLVTTQLKNDKDLYNGVLLSTLNDPKLEASLKMTCFKLYDSDPEIQDKLFKSLKNPPNEIREKFWERNKEKILSGEFFGFKLKDMDAETIKGKFMSVKKEPLKSLFIENISATECKNLNEYREVFENSNLPNIFTNEKHVEAFLTYYFSVIKKHAKTLLQDDMDAGKVNDLNEQHRQNAKKIVDYLLKDDLVDYGGFILPFRELFQGGEKRFTFTVNGQTVCDIDRDKLRSRAEQRTSIERKKLNQRLQTAQSNLKKAEAKRNSAPNGTKAAEEARREEKKANEDLKTAKKAVEGYPKVELKDFMDEIKTQIKRKNIKKASIEKLALFLASGISLMPPTDQFGRGICGMNRCHCNCTVSEKGTLIINQKFDKVKSAQGSELYTRFRKATDKNPVFKSVIRKCYTETSMEIEKTFDLFTSGSRNPKTSNLKSFEHTVKFTD